MLLDYFKRLWNRTFFKPTFQLQPVLLECIGFYYILISIASTIFYYFSKSKYLSSSFILFGEPFPEMTLSESSYFLSLYIYLPFFVGVLYLFLYYAFGVDSVEVEYIHAWNFAYFLISCLLLFGFYLFLFLSTIINDTDFFINCLEPFIKILEKENISIKLLEVGSIFSFLGLLIVSIRLILIENIFWFYMYLIWLSLILIAWSIAFCNLGICPKSAVFNAHKLFVFFAWPIWWIPLFFYHLSFDTIGLCMIWSLQCIYEWGLDITNFLCFRQEELENFITTNLFPFLVKYESIIFTSLVILWFLFFLFLLYYSLDNFILANSLIKFILQSPFGHVFRSARVHMQMALIIAITNTPPSVPRDWIWMSGDYLVGNDGIWFKVMFLGAFLPLVWMLYYYDDMFNIEDYGLPCYWFIVFLVLFFTICPFANFAEAVVYVAIEINNLCYDNPYFGYLFGFIFGSIFLYFFICWFVVLFIIYFLFFIISFIMVLEFLIIVFFTHLNLFFIIFFPFTILQGVPRILFRCFK